MSTIKQNALPQKMGDIFHYYVAIKLLLDNNSWNKCQIEQSGDIALFDKDDKQIYNIEVKHHNSRNELKVYEEDFLKTLSNWFDIKIFFNEKTKLILMTTSNIPSGNPLEFWNQFDSNKKYKTIIDNQKKNDGTYYANVSTYFVPINKNVDELKELLKKIDIQHSLSNLLVIRDEIKNVSYFRSFKDDEENKKDNVIDSLYGLIGSSLLNQNKWEITKSQFDQKLRELTSLVQNKQLRTDNDINIRDIDTSFSNYKDKQFIRKLQDIEFKDEIFIDAMGNYAKTILELAERMRLKTSLDFDERLINYDSSLVSMVNFVKVKHGYSRDFTNIEKSQNSYFEIIGSSKIPFMPEEFDDQTTYFQKGYLHVLADDDDDIEKIVWKLKD